MKNTSTLNIENSQNISKILRDLNEIDRVIEALDEILKEMNAIISPIGIN